MTDYEILGLPENADKRLVERKYGALLRQYKARTDEHGVTDEDAEYYKKITGAHDRILGLDPGNYDDNPTSVVPYPVRRFFGKMATFFEQNRVVMIIAAIIVAIGVIFIIQATQAKRYDINIKFIGALDCDLVQPLADDIAATSESVANPAVSFYTITTSTGYSLPALNQATQFKSQLIGRQIDVLFLDTEGWIAYRNEKAFYRLDDLLKEGDLAKAAAGRLVLEYEQSFDENGIPNGPESGKYAIEITGSDYLKHLAEHGLKTEFDREAGQPENIYIAICGTTQNPDKALAYVLEVLNYVAS